MTWLAIQRLIGVVPIGSHERARLARLREVGGALLNEGVERLWLWGAGAHTAWVLDHAPELGVPIAGVVDDALAGRHRHGFRVGEPDELPGGAHALISTDRHEREIWERAAPLRERGVRVWRLYTGDGDA
jgi:hypothetical protein